VEPKFPYVLAQVLFAEVVPIRNGLREQVAHGHGAARAMQVMEEHDDFHVGPFL
jgi:hypothetical protein